MTRQDIIDYCLTLPGSYEDYPFDSVSTPGAWTVMRHGTNRKTFALIYERGGRLCVNVKCDPFEADFLRQVYRDVETQKMPTWNYVYVGGDVPEEELRRMIGNNYGLTKPKQNRRPR